MYAPGKTTAMEHADPIHSNLHLMLLVLVTTLGPFQFGYHLSELNALHSSLVCPIITSLSESRECLTLTTPQWAITQSIYTIGGLGGALSLGGQFVTHHGEITAMKVIALVFILGSATEALSLNGLLIMAGRFVSGIGAGAATVVCPIYLAKIAPPARRGLFGTFTQVMINFGIFVGTLAGTLLGTKGHWRSSLTVGVFAGMIMLFGLAFVQEPGKKITDRKISVYQFDEERQPLLASPQPESTTPVTSLPRTVTKDSSSDTCSVTPFTVLRDLRHRRATIAIIAVMMAQQLTGINSVVIYSVSILNKVIPGNAENISTLVAAVIVIATVVFAPLPDKIGNKACLLISIAGMGISSALLAISLSKDITFLVLPALLGFVTSFGAGLGPVPFMLASDLVSSEAVGAVSSLALTACFLSTFVVAQFFPIIDSALGAGQVFWIFAGVALVFGSFIAWILPNGREESA